MRKGASSFFFCLMLFTSATAQALDPVSEAEDQRDAGASVLQRGVTSRYAHLRKKVARAFGRIQKPDSIGPLVSLAWDRNPEISEEAVFALGQLGWNPSLTNLQREQITHVLKPLLSSKIPSLRQAVIEALGKIGGPEAIELIAPFLKDPETNAEAVLAVYRTLKQQKTPEISEQILNWILGFELDSGVEVSRNLAFLLSEIPVKESQNVLLKLVQASDHWTRFYAVKALSHYSSPRILGVLLEELKDSEASVRLAAIQALQKLKQTRLLPKILMKDPSHIVRAGYVSNSTNVKAIRNRLKHDPSLYVRTEALKNMASILKEDSDGFIGDFFVDSNWVYREAALDAGSYLPDTAKWRLIQDALKDPDSRIRAQAVEKAGEIHTYAAHQIIEKALKSETLAERAAAVGVISRRQDIESFYLAWDCFEQSEGEKWVELREEVVKYLAKFSTQEAVSYLKLVAENDPFPSVSALAIEALQKRNIKKIPTSHNKPFSHSPYRELKFSRNPKIHISTEKGELVLELFPEEAPIHVGNFVGFASSGGFNGLPFHRVIPNYVLQGGDPDGTGYGSNGYLLRAEINRLRFTRGSLGMPRSSGFDTGGIQFFITHVPTPQLDGKYTLFGKVVQGMDVMDRIEKGDTLLEARVEF